MCFSATASFTAAAVLTVTGAATLTISISRRLSPAEQLLAAFPLVFGLQQAAEGVVWLSIGGSATGWISTLAASLFICTAFGFWPVAGPLVGWALEPSGGWRKPTFAALVLAGLAVAVHLLYGAFTHPITPLADPEWGGHIWYVIEFERWPFIEFMYFFTACSALLLSSNRTAFWFGLVLAAGFIFTLLAYKLAVVTSVWCFFAAVGSLVIVAGFLRQPAPNLAAQSR
jgi:MFS family permease